MSSAPSDPQAGPRGFNPTASFRAVGVSLVVNALFPYLLYGYLEPRFPANSVLPLLYAMIFPVAGFLFGVVRKRALDAIALIVLFGLVFHLAVTAAAPDIGTALVLRSFQGGLVGLFFLASAAIGRPAVLYIARQFVLAAAGAAGALQRGGRRRPRPHLRRRHHRLGPGVGGHERGACRPGAPPVA